ncbi:MAG: hypothetical protein HC915_06995 [Anaerolineae bacterium]|nr:hypothetical protein [Anaerolineae bacterium]
MPTASPGWLRLRGCSSATAAAMGATSSTWALSSWGLASSPARPFRKCASKPWPPGDSIAIGDYFVRYDQLSEAEAIDGRGMLVVDVSLFRGDRLVDHLRPRRDFFGANSSPMTIAGQHSTAETDIYVLLTFWEGDQVTLRVYNNPLVNFVWWGSLVLVLGTAIAVYPNAEKAPEKRKRPVNKWVQHPAGAGD